MYMYSLLTSHPKLQNISLLLSCRPGSDLEVNLLPDTKHKTQLHYRELLFNRYFTLIENRN